MFKNTLRKILNSIPGDVLLAIDVTVFLNKILEKYLKNFHKSTVFYALLHLNFSVIFIVCTFCAKHNISQNFISFMSFLVLYKHFNFLANPFINLYADNRCIN